MSDLRAARGAAAKALQIVIHEAAMSGRPFIPRDMAEHLVDAIAMEVLEALASFEEDQREARTST